MLIQRMKDESTSRLTVDGLRNASEQPSFAPEIYAFGSRGEMPLWRSADGGWAWGFPGAEQAGTFFGKTLWRKEHFEAVVFEGFIPFRGATINSESCQTHPHANHYQCRTLESTFKISVIRNFADRLSADLVAGHAKIQLAGFAFIRPRQGPAQKNQSIISRSLKGSGFGDWYAGGYRVQGYEWVKRQFPA
ncbi:hypothetical protein CEXT_257941 [Caerostris extrusa]|uniref:Uncharacterized protein n=1 Tax=Caerostris extrusa TaxID=172846 RepID=A0AAV4VKH1_CAEEX|nr:hypothetical protein CEXT_257941 [Caerostris extrusa]